MNRIDKARLRALRNRLNSLRHVKQEQVEYNAMFFFLVLSVVSSICLCIGALSK